MRAAFYTILLFSIAFSGFSQDTPVPAPTPPPTQNPPPGLNPQPKEFDRFIDRLYFGGNVGAWFGQTTYINLQPLVGCKLTKKFSLGGGFTYNYFSQNYGGQKYVSTVYGSNAFARYFVLDNVFAQVGWDHLSVPDFTSPLPDTRAWVDNILLGGGYRQQFSDHGSFIAMIFYNVNQSPLSPYANPIVQIGFNVGF